MLRPLKIAPGAASMSYDLKRGAYHVATVWSGAATPSETAARHNAETLARAFSMESALRTALERLAAMGAETRDLVGALPPGEA